jgi:glucoamylase
MRIRGDRVAFGGPGIPPRWTHGNKDGVGTAYSQDSKVWYTLWRGVLTELYYPLIDHPQVRDAQFLVTDGETFFHEEKRHLASTTARLSDRSLGYRIRSADPEGRYTIDKEVIASPHLPVVLEHVRFQPAASHPTPLSLFALVAPHLDVGGWGNTASVVELPGRTVLAAEHNGTWLAVGADAPFTRCSVGFVGASDGWTDVNEHYALAWEFDQAPNGNVALTGQIDPKRAGQFTLGLAFGRGLPHAVTALLQALGLPYEEQRQRFIEQWDRASTDVAPLAGGSGDRGNLANASQRLLLAHEDKTFPGAFIASLSIPWGFAKSDDDRGGYHLVWTRDLVQIALGLLASGDTATPLRTLIYLAGCQQPDGGFPQNCWVDGARYWTGVQLDEVAFPILLALRLREAHALESFDPRPMVAAAARFLVASGPVTQQERWEEVSGFSPSTLAVVIAALIGAARFARDDGNEAGAVFFEEYADFLESHLERWTLTSEGTLLAGVPAHYVRILPATVGDPHPVEDPNAAVVRLTNQPPGARTDYPAKEVVDAGFLELVRYGIRSPRDPRIVDSLRVVDAVLRVETPVGTTWHRYNHDGYGDRDDGGPYVDWGVGRAWPLLTGERGHYELAAGRDASEFLRTMERFATPTGLLPEQVWDGPDQPGLHLRRGRPTGAAMPLAWAHAEYLRLLRSVQDRVVFDRRPELAERYQGIGRRSPAREVWTARRQPSSVRSTETLRVIAFEPFDLHWSIDEWSTVTDTAALGVGPGAWYVDLPRLPAPGRRVRFTFRWSGRGVWEGRDYDVVVVADPPTLTRDDTRGAGSRREKPPLGRVPAA